MAVRPGFMFAPQQTARPQVDMTNIYGSMGATNFDPDALRKQLIARYAGQAGQTPAYNPSAVMSNYTGEVMSGMSDFARLIRNMGIKGS